ncbi:MAG: anthranilate phosphoribosyltransferase [Candidatus Melainabacteria bacterium RIFOXYA12_FULL_32_12]|nr:MAG: anthranilate phosphoribosyltransferase [Candidatus Melainabacteria bacterium RIFOXYA2_FULL_32_9]OGI25459.1 MAG: anthranilate phosphoribosyltransferase [Candidatus Melainabacteria bacterium RIFOXYA12_FULL_32_12]
MSEEKLREFGRLICNIAAGKFMTREEACDAYRQVILNEQPELQQGALLMAHIARGPSTEELSGAWDALDMYDTAKFEANISGTICDIVGTGSDALKTVNCSSPASIIAAACGVPVAKKGAKKVTGVSGATEIFQILGIDIDTPVMKSKESLEKVGFCYLPGEAFLKSGWARLIQSMRFTSAFNIIGPLTRPCVNTSSIVIGAYAPHICDQLIAVLKEIGMKTAVAPYGWAYDIDKNQGMDEFSNIGPTRVVELKDSKIEIYEVTPEDFGVKTVKYDDIATRNSAQDNAKVILEVLSGQYDTPIADLFCMNAGAALYVAGFAKNYQQGTEMAKAVLASGKAYEKLEQIREFHKANHTV